MEKIIGLEMEKHYVNQMIEIGYKAYTVFPHIVSAETIIFEFGNPKVRVHKAKGQST